MRYRALGGTGIEVSVHCLGTMMLGAVGNPDAGRPGAAGQDPRVRLLDLPGRADRRLPLRGRAPRTARFRTEQPPYSLLARGVEASVLPVCERWGMGVLTWGPLASGFLSGRYRKGVDGDLSRGRALLNPARFDPTIPENQVKLEVTDRLAELAGQLGRTLPELAVAFPLAHRAVTSVIIGPRTMEQLDGLLKGAYRIVTTRHWTGSTRSSRRDEPVPRAGRSGSGSLSPAATGRFALPGRI